MGRTKKEINVSTRITRTKADIAIEERLAGCGRKERNHIIYVGELVERNLRGEIGAILKALTAGRISQELYASKTNGLSADRVLGRLEMADLFWNDLEQFVHDKDQLIQREIERSNQPQPDSVQEFNYEP